MLFQYSTVFGVANILAYVMAMPKLAPRELSENDVLLWGSEGEVEVIDRAKYRELLAQQARPPIPADMKVFNTSAEVNTTGTFEKRCDKETFLVPNPPQYFLNWDVPMSAIVHATGLTNTIAVTQGYSIANGISVSQRADFGLVKDILTLSYGVEYSYIWTSNYMQAYTFVIPEGKWGVVVSNPATTRNSGFIAEACIGSREMEKTEYMADSYTSKSYSTLAWVEGAISLCIGDSYPIPMCLGDGTLS